LFEYRQKLAIINTIFGSKGEFMTKIVIDGEVFCGKIADNFLTEEDKSKDALELPFVTVAKKLNAAIFLENKTVELNETMSLTSTAVGVLTITLFSITVFEDNLPDNFKILCTIGMIAGGIILGMLSNTKDIDSKETSRQRKQLEQDNQHVQDFLTTTHHKKEMLKIVILKA
jgi:hypothetical protein